MANSSYIILCMLFIFQAEQNEDPATLRAKLVAAKQFYPYIIVGKSNDYQPPIANTTNEITCFENEVAAFLIAAEPGCFILCNGYDESQSNPLGLPLGDPVINNATQTWSRNFTSGTTGSVFVLRCYTFHLPFASVDKYNIFHSRS